MDASDTSLINVFMELTTVNDSEKMEKKEQSDEAEEYYDYDEEYYDEEASGSGDGEEGSGETDIESRVFSGGRMSLGRGGRFPGIGNRRKSGMNMMNNNRAMGGRGGGLRSRLGLLNRRQGLVTNRSTGSSMNFKSQSVAGDDYKEEDYDEYLNDEAYSTADSAVDATDSKYDIGLEGLGGAAAGANRRIGIDLGGNRGQGLYGADRQGFASGPGFSGGFAKFNGFQNFGVGSGFNGIGDAGTVNGNGRRFGGYGSGAGGGAGYKNFKGIGGGLQGYQGASGGLRQAGYQGLGGGGGQTQGGYQGGGGRAGTAGGLGGGGGQAQGGYQGQGGVAMSRDYGYNDYGGGFGGGYGGGYGGGGYGGGGGSYEDQLVLLRPPASSRNRGGLGSISELIDIDYETLVLLLGVAGAGASWVLYQTILTKGRRSFKQLKKAEQQDNVLDKVADFLNIGK